jgi:hypothetical protein
VAQFLFGAAPEFHATNKNPLMDIPRDDYQQPSASPSHNPSTEPTAPRSHAPTPVPSMTPTYCTENVTIVAGVSDFVEWSKVGTNGVTGNVTVPAGTYTLEDLAVTWSALTLKASTGATYGLVVVLNTDNHTYTFGLDTSDVVWKMPSVTNKAFWNAIGHEYKVTGALTQSSPQTTTLSLGCAPTPAPATEPYKAVIFMMLNGACDTYNLLVPHSQCDSNKVNAQYTSVRGDVALDMDELLQVGEAHCAREHRNIKPDGTAYCVANFRSTYRTARSRVTSLEYTLRSHTCKGYTRQKRRLLSRTSVR